MSILQENEKQKPTSFSSDFAWRNYLFTLVITQMVLEKRIPGSSQGCVGCARTGSLALCYVTRRTRVTFALFWKRFVIFGKYCFTLITHLYRRSVHLRQEQVIPFPTFSGIILQWNKHLPLEERVVHFILCRCSHNAF